jgi:hypothetical protein
LEKLCYGDVFGEGGEGFCDNSTKASVKISVMTERGMESKKFKVV